MILFEGGSPKQYLGDLRHADDSNISDIAKASKVKEWVMSSLEAQDRIVVKEISPEAFKNEPNQHSHVCFIFSFNAVHFSEIFIKMLSKECT